MLDVKDMVLRHKDFEVSANLEAIEPGIYALIGPSGSGKSSFLMALAGFLQPAQGHVVWQGKDITSAPPSQRPISILFQDNNLFPHLTIKRNVAFAISQNAKLLLQHTSGMKRNHSMLPISSAPVLLESRLPSRSVVADGLPDLKI